LPKEKKKKKSKVYIGELIYIFIQKIVGRAIYLRSEA
jgi:hypothetical protein